MPPDQLSAQAIFMRLMINFILGAVVRQDGRWATAWSIEPISARGGGQRHRRPRVRKFDAVGRALIRASAEQGRLKVRMNKDRDLGHCARTPLMLIRYRWRVKLRRSAKQNPNFRPLQKILASALSLDPFKVIMTLIV